MTYSQIVVFVLEIIGTIAFASSGAMVGIRKNMDIFGVNVLGITTALGGGLIRDLILNISPPNMFRYPSYVIMSIITSTILFIVAYFNKELLKSKYMEIYERAMTSMDAIGLAAFTIIGINTAVLLSYTHEYFLLIFVGVITGVGGGMLRDIMAGTTPYIFVKHVYACASIAGAILCVILKDIIGNAPAMVIGAGSIVIIRYLAVRYHWNLPKIQ